LVKSPSTYAPTVSPERATARRNVVLQAMRENGVIDRSQQLAAAKTKIALHDSLRREEPHGQYFKEEVRKQLVDQFGWQRVYQGGLRVFTTIDTRMQEAAEMEVERGISEIEARRKARRVRASVPLDSTQRLQGALVALDPQTCEVRAMVGGRSFEDSHFNRAVQAKRQPGSAFKPFVYAAALEAGFTPATVLDQLDDAVVTMQGMWMPEDEHSSASSMTLRTALRTSSNRAAVKLLNRVGIPNAVSYAKRMGVGEVPGVPSLALGSGEVTLVSMTAAYSAFANGGLTRTPVLIRRVEDREGHVLTSADEPPRQVIKETTSFLMASMLADVVNAGTAYRARRLGFTLPAAGKTGTTNDFNDAWFVGFTPKIVAAVWIGFDQPQTILPNGYAGELAVPIWARFMKLATKGEKPAWFTPPAGMVTASICRISGKLATPACEDVEVMTDAGQIEHRSMVYTEYFVRGTQPTSSCDIHQQRSFFDRIAGLFGKPEAPPPVRADDVDLPTVTGKGPAAAAPTIAGGEPQVQGGTIENKDEEPKKKRGFWSRVFGIGKDKSKKDKEKEKDNDKDREF
jgi:penicillin-binding protein 1A